MLALKKTPFHARTSALVQGAEWRRWAGYAVASAYELTPDREYMAIRIAEYWLFDRFRRILTVFRREGRKVIEIVIREGENYTTALLPGFELSLRTLLEVADSMRVVEPAQEQSNGRRKRRRGA